MIGPGGTDPFAAMETAFDTFLGAIDAALDQHKARMEAAFAAAKEKAERK